LGYQTKRPDFYVYHKNGLLAIVEVKTTTESKYWKGCLSARLKIPLETLASSFSIAIPMPLLINASGSSTKTLLVSKTSRVKIYLCIALFHIFISMLLYEFFKKNPVWLNTGLLPPTL